MKFPIILLVSLTLAASQETDSDILTLMEDDSLTESEQEELESNIEETEVLDSSTDDEETETQDLDLTELQAENDSLISEQDLLKQQLEDATSKLDAYIASIEDIDLNYQSKVKNLDDYNHMLIRDILVAAEEEEALAEAQEEEEDDEEEEEDELKLSGATIFVITLGFAFLFLHGIRAIFGFTIQPFLNPAFYSLFLDETILLIICLVVSIIYQIDLIDDDVIDFSLILIGIALFTFFWLLLGLWFIIAAQSFSRTWTRHEKSCQNIRNLTHIFQEAQIDLAGGNIPRRLKSIYKDFQYAIMRQLFICPTFLPPVTETYLRIDFNLAEYLSRCIADVINKVFQLNWLGYSFIIVSILVWRVIIALDEKAQFIALWGLPGFVLLVSISFILKLNNVYNKLVPLPTDQIVINLPKDNFGRSPEMNVDIIPKPDYLAGHFYSNDREANYVNCCFVKLHPLKLTWSYLFNGNYPNRHELLYWGDRYGTDIIVSLIQGLSISLTLWITIILLYYIPILHESFDWVGTVMIISCIFIWLFISCYLLPEVIRLLTLTSKIEMKKDRRIIEDTIVSEKAEKAKVIVRIYRQFKMIFREKYGENPKANDAVLMEYAREAFSICKDQESNGVDVEDLEDLIALCGVKLDEDELRLFAKECKPEGNRNVTEEGFCDAIRILLGSRKLRPEFVVKVVLTRYFKEGRGKNIQEVSLEEIKDFFNDFWWHFTEDDIQDFLWEARFVLEDIGTAEINEIAGMVKNNVKNYAR